MNKLYIKENRIRAEVFGRGTAWFDTGTSQSLLAASNFVHSIQESQGYIISCLEEISYRNNWVSKKVLKKIVTKRPQNTYNNYILELL